VIRGSGRVGSGLGGIGARMGAPLIKVLERQGMRTRCAMNASGVGRIDGRWRPLCDGDGPAYHSLLLRSCVRPRPPSSSARRVRVAERRREREEPYPTGRSSCSRARWRGDDAGPTAPEDLLWDR
jgi:hypothetical protein